MLLFTHKLVSLGIAVLVFENHLEFLRMPTLLFSPFTKIILFVFPCDLVSSSAFFYHYYFKMFCVELEVMVRYGT